MALKPGVPELVDGAGLPQYSALVGVVQEPGQRPGQATGQRKGDAGQDHPLPPCGKGQGVGERNADPADHTDDNPVWERPAKRAN